MKVHVVDGTYELFRHYFAVPSSKDVDGMEVGAIRGVLNSMLRMIRDGATHIGVATDHVVESFRNELYEGYKTGEGMEPELWDQFHPLEDALRAMGIVVWPMIEYEADDGLASAAVKAAADPRVEKVFICTADKDLGQCVSGDRIVQFDRRREIVRNDAGVREKFGVSPQSIPDYLALVGDAADGFPGLSGWGQKSTATVLARYGHLESIPEDPAAWDVPVRSAAKLRAILDEQWDLALLFRNLATLRTDAEVFESVDELRWKGPTPEFEGICARLGDTGLARRARTAALRITESQ
jgi:5'-3' exonuclease